MLPFTRAEFLNVFVAYNHAIWPAQWVAYLLGAAVVALVFFRAYQSDRLIAGVLSLMWLWTGIGYHALAFAQINKAAWLFAGLFAIQGIYIAYAGVARNDLHFGWRGGLAAWVGAVLIVYAMIAYPLIGMATGHSYPEMPMFGVTPCPVTLFTFGVLLLTVRPLSRWLLVIPFLWSLVGGSAAILLGVPQDWLLLVSGLIAVPLIVMNGSTQVSPAAPVVGSRG